jgi:hypothetical protein
MDWKNLGDIMPQINSYSFFDLVQIADLLQAILLIYIANKVSKK